MGIVNQQPSGRTTFATDDDLLALVLRPYRAQCRYLKTAQVETTADMSVTVSGDLEDRRVVLHR